MPGLRSTSIAAELGRRAEPPSTSSVADAARVFAPALARRLRAALAWSDDDPGEALPTAGATARMDAARESGAAAGAGR